ncbi:hypothetical protein LLZ88_00495 [Ureaplasma urealyticum]|uniref:hypothetical protein n=1 Tax=Ureaplasma urealyticum TaxID=2130 RepID=UPI001F31EC41|nr:hypothetical protein [Ureaplasma urealyticum]UIU15166.1 hypothetical protein LLZ88_00495 [Ureaplasma urealyticum]
MIKKWNSKRKWSLICASLVIGSASVVTATACANTNNKVVNAGFIYNGSTTNDAITGFDINDYIIKVPSSDVNLNQQILRNNNYEQKPILWEDYLKQYDSVKKQHDQQTKSFYEYVWINKASKYKNLNKAIDINDPYFADWFLKLTPNTLKNDLYDFINDIRKDNMKPSLVFSSSEPQVEVWKDLGNNQKQKIAPNQVIFEPLTQEDTKNNVTLFKKNKHLRVNISFWYALTNQNSANVLINDPFYKKPSGIASNTSEKYFINIQNSPISLSFSHTDRLEHDIYSAQTTSIKNTYKMRYYFDNIRVEKQVTKVKSNAKRGDQNAEENLAKEFYFANDNNEKFSFGTRSYTLNNEITQASYEQDIFSLDQKIKNELKKLNQQQILKDIEYAFASGYDVAIDSISSIFNILKGVANDLDLKELFLQSTQDFKNLTYNITQHNNLTNLIALITSNQSLGVVIDGFKPILKEIIYKNASIDQSVKNTIWSKIESMDFKNNLIAEIGQIKTLLDSISLAEIKTYKPIINKLLELISLIEARSKKDPKNYGFIDGLDELFSFFLNLKQDDLPSNINFKIGDQNYGLYDLIVEVKKIVDNLVPHENQYDPKNQQIISTNYFLSKIKVLDLISLNKINELDYRKGVESIFSLLKKFQVAIPEIVYKIIDELLIQNTNWNKENIKKLLDAILYPKITSNDASINDLKSYFKYGISKPEITSKELEYDQNNLLIKKLNIKYRYKVLANAEFDIKPLFDLLPQKAPSFINIGSLWDQIKKEFPYKVVLAKDDYVDHTISINEPQELTPLVFQDRSDHDKYKIGYSFYPTHTVQTHMPNSMKAIIEEISSRNDRLLPNKYIAQLLSWLFYKKWVFTNPLAIYETFEGDKKVANDKNVKYLIKDNLNKYLKHYDTNTYYEGFDFKHFSNNLENKVNNQTIRNLILAKIKTIKTDGQELYQDKLGRKVIATSAYDQINLTLQELIDYKLLEFGKKVDLKKDVYLSAVAFNFGLNTNDSDQTNALNNNDEIKYNLNILKKVVITLHFTKPTLDLSDPNHPKLVNSYTFVV